ncbi:MAG: transporter substrate-binding domain-containing protein [Oscillospiraceae bacterium]|jgi:polar amino acid transport system substrate-binding protein|nr:transporter substrate-binding domain-containing protein [Oscillospiraceae bacterium]
MKKILAIVLAAVMLLSFAFAGCSKGETSDWEYIKAKGELLIGITYYAPMNYLDDDGKLIGFETEFAEAVCAKLGLTPTFVVIDWSAKETELSAKSIDVIWNGMTHNEEREKNMDLSADYLHNRPVVIVRDDKVELYKTPDDVAGAVVIAEKGSMADDIAQTDEFFLQGSYTAVDTQIKAFMELKAGSADLAVGDYVMAIGSLGEGTDFENLVISPYKTFDEESYAMAFRKGSPETVKVFNDAIAELLADGTLQQIAEKYKLDELLIK